MSDNKKIVLNVGYGKTALVNEYYKGSMSSRHFYGSIELEKSGRYHVINVSLDSNQGIKGTIHNNIMMLKTADVVFIPYLFVAPFIALSILKHMGLTHKKMIAICHTRMKKSGSRIVNLYYKMIYHSFDVVFFHSQKNMEESIADKSINPSKARFLYWGDDLDYIDNTFTNCTQGDFFISTGREQRDYDSIVSAFKDLNIPLEIYTNRLNYTNHYDTLEKIEGVYPNIRIEFVERNNSSTIRLAKRTSECLCVVIPLLNAHINYCLGLTSVVEAMAMGKPIISSYNPYSPVDIEKERIGMVVGSGLTWKDAIEYMATHREEAREMGKRGRLLAERLFNIKNSVSQLEDVINS